MTTTQSREAAEQIAAALVGGRLAACVQTLGPITSTYHWEGAVETGEEWLCLIKTTAAAYHAVEQEIKRLHTYAVPEIIAVPLVAGSEDYLRWVAAEVGAQ